MDGRVVIKTIGTIFVFFVLFINENQILLFATSLILLVFSGYQLFQESRLKQWIQIPAKIISFNIKSFMRVVTRGFDEQFTPEIQYEYIYKGVTYRSNSLTRVKYDCFFFDPEKIKRICPYNRTTKEIQIFINPKDPTQSYVYIGMGWGSFILYYTYLFLGLLGLIIGITRLILF